MDIIDLVPDEFFLRDDYFLYKDDPSFSGKEKECYSLCKYKDEEGNYHREMVFRGPLEWAVQQANTYIEGYKAGERNIIEKIKLDKDKEDAIMEEMADCEGCFFGDCKIHP